MSVWSTRPSRHWPAKRTLQVSIQTRAGAVLLAGPQLLLADLLAVYHAGTLILEVAVFNETLLQLLGEQVVWMRDPRANVRPPGLHDLFPAWLSSLCS